MRRSLAVASVVLGLVALVLGVLSVVQGRSNSVTVQPQPVASPTPTRPEAFATPTPTAAPTPSETPSPTPTPTPTSQQPAADAVPAWLSIPAIGIDESILPQGLNARGELEPPPGQTIWYTGSSKPGQGGISVVAGHVQWGPTPDNFWRLNELPDGTSFTITYSDGTTTEWVTVSKRSELKEDVQRDQEVWGPSDVPVTVLITCDKASPVVGHHYTNNLLVFARPA